MRRTKKVFERGRIMKSVVNRFLKYISIDTQGNEENTSCPSNENEKLLASLLLDELRDMGVVDAYIDEKSFLYAKIPSNSKKKIPSLAFFAHLDTSPEVQGGNIKPRIIENYDGQPIVLNERLKMELCIEEFPYLKECCGKDLIVTDGTTILGADGKAGIAEIMEAVHSIQESPQLEHGELYIVFTPDEELGYSTEYISMEAVPAQVGFTIEGGAVGELNYENFNAATVSVIVNGVSGYPGHAKNRMKNAILLAEEYMATLPKGDIPAHTQGYEGYYHISDIRGGVEQCRMTYNIRDFDLAGYEYRKRRMQEIADFLNAYYGEKTFVVEIEDYYLNMKQKIDEYPEIINIAKKAILLAEVEPKVIPVRGGTDGVTISFMGIPCPNLFSGGYNAQSVQEFIPIQSMEKAVQVIINVVTLFAESGEEDMLE